MKHPKTKINLADALGGKIANEKPLAAGDKVIERYGEEEYRDVHCIYGQVNTHTIYMRNEQSSLLWGRTVEARNRESLTKDEAQRLLCADNKELLKSWHRINPDGTKTSLGDIYRERVDVGVGSWILDRTGSPDALYCVITNWLAGETYLYDALRCCVLKAATIPNNKGSLSIIELNQLGIQILDRYDLLPPADALAMLGEMEGE